MEKDWIFFARVRIKVFQLLFFFFFFFFLIFFISLDCESLGVSKEYRRDVKQRERDWLCLYNYEKSL